MLAPNPDVRQPTQPLLVNSREAAAMLSISERKLWTLANRGDIRRLKLDSRLVRFAVADLKAYVERQQQAAG